MTCGEERLEQLFARLTNASRAFAPPRLTPRVAGYALSQRPEVVEALALCNKRIEVVGTDLYKVTQEVTDAVDVMAATKSLDAGAMTIEDVLGKEPNGATSRRLSRNPCAPLASTNIRRSDRAVRTRTSMPRAPCRVDVRTRVVVPVPYRSARRMACGKCFTPLTWRA